MDICKINQICIVGLGYVGLPLAIEFAEYFDVVGYDKDPLRVKELTNGIDRTEQFDGERLKSSKNLVFTDDESVISKSNCYIIAVPTPLAKDNTPDLTALKLSCDLIGKHLKIGDIVIFELFNSLK